MFSFHFTSFRAAFVSASAALLGSAVLVAAAVLPAQTATAAVFHF